MSTDPRDFTQWLEKNIDLLNEALDLNLTGASRERAAGDFSVDLVAEDEDGGAVVIENQLEKSNHDHLGKLITYLAYFQATAAIWIVSNPRPEHVAALVWLNSTSSAEFYMVKVEAVRIADSPAAAVFTLIVGPTPEGKAIGTAKKQIAEDHLIRKKWWADLIKRSIAVNKLHANITPRERGWISTNSGVRGLNFNYVVMRDECRVELYIDRGTECAQENEQIFDQLSANREAIEKLFGEPLEWERLEGRRACRIQYTREEGGYKSPEKDWPQIQDKTVHDMDRLEKALRPYIEQLKISS